LCSRRWNVSSTRAKSGFEITTLLIPGENDSRAEIEAESDWSMSHLGPDVPLHFTAFHPDWKMTDHHLVGAASHRLRHSNAERLGGLEIDDELDLGGLLDWQIRWLLALENAAGIDAFGSKADITLRNHDVRFAPESGHR
jgi:hypothetical protein